MKKPDWHAVVAIVLTLGIASSIILVSIETLLHPGHISPEENTLLSTILGAGIGAIATYLGVSRSNGQPDEAPPAVTLNAPPEEHQH